MADNTIDTLELKIESDAQQAADGIERLAQTLANLEKATGRGESSLGRFANVMRDFAKSFRSLEDADNAAKSLGKVGDAAERISKTSLKLNGKELEDAVNRLKEQFKDVGADFKFTGNVKDIEKTISELNKKLVDISEKTKRVLNTEDGIKESNLKKIIYDISEIENKIKALRKIQSSSLSKQPDVVGTEVVENKKNLEEYIQEIQRYEELLKSGGIETDFGKNMNLAISSAQMTLGQLIEEFPQATKEISELQSIIDRMELEKPIESLKSETEETIKTVEAFGNVISDLKLPEMGKGGISSFAEKINDIIDETRQMIIAKEEIGGLQTLLYTLALVAQKTSSGMDKLKEKVYATATEINRMREAGENVSGAKIGFYILGKSLLYPGIIIDKIKEKFQGLRKSTKEIGTEDPFNNLESSAETVEKAVDNVAEKTKKVSKSFKLSSLSAEEFQERLNSLLIPTTLENNLSRLQSKLKSVEEQEQKLLYEQEKGLSLGTIEIDDDAFRNLQVKIKETQLTAEMLREKIAQVTADIEKESAEAAKAWKNNLGNLKIAKITETDPKKLTNSLKKLESDLEKAKVNLQNDITMGKIVVDDSGYRKAIEKITLIEKTIDATKNRMNQLGIPAGGIDKTQKSMSSAQAMANLFARAISNLVSKLEQLGKKAINIAVNGFKKFGDGIKKAISNIKKLISAVAKLVKENKKSNNSMGISFKKILQYAFGIRSLYMLIRKMKQAFGEGIDNLVQYSDEVNHSVSLMTSALGALKNALAVAFSPIVSVVAPYITKFINMMTDAFNAVGRFFAALTGKKIATQAIKYYKDYAESIAGVGDAAKDADKALHTLGIDELNILNEDKSDSGAGDIGIEDMFTDVAIEGAISDWAKKIRDAFLAGDWEGLGKTIAEMMNAGLQKVYDAIVDITPKVEQALKNFAKVFNAFVEYLDWDLLGRTIGAGINLLVKAFNALTGDGGINFENLGRKLSVGFRGLVDEVNWGELGNALGNGFMVAWRIFQGFVEDMWRVSEETFLTGWAELGNALAEGVHGIFERVNFGTIGKTLSDAFNGIFEIINNFNQKMSDNGTWQEIANNISNGLNNAIKGIRPIEAAQALGKFVTDLLGTMLEVAENTPWHELGTKIGQFLTNIPWYTIFTQIFDIITTVLGGLFGGLISELLLHFGEIGTALADGFNYAFEKLREFTANVPWDSIAVNIYTGLNNMIHGIDWAGTGETLSGFVVKLLGVFQEVSANTDWEAFGRGIGEFLSNIEWGTIIGQVFDILWEIFSGCISGLFDTSAGKVIVAFTAGLTALTGVFNLVDIASKAFKWITTASDTLGGLKGLILTKVVPNVSSAIGTLGGLFSKISTAAQGAFSGAGILSKIGSVIFSPHGLLIAGVIAGVALIVTHWDEIKEVAKNLWENVLVPFGNFLKDTFVKIWKDVLAPALSYLADTILPPLADIFSNLWNEILVPLGKFVADTLGPVFQVLGKILGWLISNVVAPVAKAFTDELGGALKVAADIVGDVGKVLQGLIEFISGVFTGDWEKAWEGVKDIFKGIFNLIPDIAEGVINSVIRFINGIIGGLNDVTGLVGIPSIPTIPEVNLPRFENGGLVMSHMVAEIGEYGKKEAVLPLENRKAMSMIADSIMENSKGTAFNDNQISDELLQEQNALLREQNKLLTQIANTRQTAVLDTRDTLAGLREQANREGWVFG